jgi:uncharacterized membrane protein
MGENHFAAVPTAIYGTILLLAAIAYYILQITIVKTHGENSVLSKAIGRDLKGKLSPILYLAAIVSVFVSPWIAQTIYVIVALIWIVPDKRIEKVLFENSVSEQD